MRISESYQVLGLPFGSDLNTIKETYRKLAKKYHPDHGGTDSKLFCKINEAYIALKKWNPPKKNFTSPSAEIVDVFAMGDLLKNGRTIHLRRFAALKLGDSGRISAYGYLKQELKNQDISLIKVILNSIKKLNARQAPKDICSFYLKGSPEIKRLIIEIFASHPGFEKLKNWSYSSNSSTPQSGFTYGRRS